MGHSFTVSLVCLQAVADVADLDLPRCLADGAGGVGAQECLLFGTHETKEHARLRVVVIVLAMVPVVGGPLQAEGRLVVPARQAYSYAASAGSR